ncbi:hypothetical protein M2338_002442 [Sphingobium sp. B2D3B]|nr:hypothetical protein [Sphingobium sp. B2D3B]MCW2396950.1 hypothetical protein [Sphingobium sp. B2D3C]
MPVIFGELFWLFGTSSSYLPERMIHFVIKINKTLVHR